LSDQVMARAERQRAAAQLGERQAAMAAHEEALRSSRRYADHTGVRSTKQQQRAELVDTYWQLMRSGETNTSACRVLGMSRRSGTTIRRAHQYQTRARVPRVVWSGRYLDVRERLQIADLLRLGCSLRRIAAELGRHPSTIKRELDRHRSLRAVTCRGPPTTTHGSNGPARGPASLPPTSRCGGWCSAS
jgi:transposase, IS30 family